MNNLNPEEISKQFISKLKEKRDKISSKTPNPNHFLNTLQDSVIDSLADMVVSKVISSFDDGEPHSIGLALEEPEEVYYVVSVFTFKDKSVQYAKQMHEWYEIEFGGYLGYLEKVINKPPVSNTPYLKTLCHIIYFITPVESIIDLCITPTSKENAAGQGVILPTDILNG